MKVLITGATGFVGSKLAKKLSDMGHEIFIVTRDVSKAKVGLHFPYEAIIADLNNDRIQDHRISEMDAVINLLGENIAEGRWTTEKKEKIYNSRVKTTKNLVSSLGGKTKVFISGSAMGFYGNRGDDILHETETGGIDFLARVCRDWEKEATRASCRTVCVRTSMVLGAEGGVLKKLLPLFKLNLGGRLGSGRQWMSWIHLEDLVDLIIFALMNESVEGVVNGCSPFPIQNKMFTEMLAGALGKRVGLPAPEFALHLALGEMSEMLLFSQRGSADKVQRLGFQFKYSSLKDALVQLIPKT